MANLKAIRKRIGSVKSTQKITRAMKMVAGARLNRAQQRILAMRPYAQSTTRILSEVLEASRRDERIEHPLLRVRPEKKVLALVVTGDRGLCGAFNSNTNKAAEVFRDKKNAAGVEVVFATLGRRGHDFLRRRKQPVFENFSGIWEDLGIATARRVARVSLAPFVTAEVDGVYIIYNEFKSAMTQQVVEQRILPLVAPADDSDSPGVDYIFEPDAETIFERLVPMYIEISILRALYDSMASELGARMTAMDAATKNADDMIAKLTLLYNRERQRAITTELTEIIGGAEALQS